MKKIIQSVLIMLASQAIYGQNNVGIGTITPHSSAALHVDLGNSTSGGLLVTGATTNGSTVPDLGAGSRLMFYPGKAAFRVGEVIGNQWDNISIGQSSVAMGGSTKANGAYSTAFGRFSFAGGENSTAMGSGTQAIGVNATAMGLSTKASGDFSTAMGSNTQATGEYSTANGYLTKAIGKRTLASGFKSEAIGDNSIAMGEETIAKAKGGLSIGRFNDNADIPNAEVAFPSDRIFQIGNGVAFNDRRNAMTVLRDGNTGFGVLDPAYRLDLAGRMRIRNGGAANQTAGIWLNKNDNSDELGFVGVDGNNDIGVYSNTSNWSLLVRTATGNLWVKGTVTANGVTLTSDERLKKDITRLDEAMPLLEQLNGYQYHWKDETADAGLQTGLMAQEVEKVLPQLVMTDDKGMKSVNYMGLIPYMLEAVKTQQSTITDQQQQINELKKMVEMLIKK